jgi:hypothetical protein
MLLYAGITVVACVTAVACLHPDSGRHSCCCWRSLSSLWFPVAGLSAIADVPGVAKVLLGFLLILSNMLLLAVLLLLAFLLLMAFLLLLVSLLILVSIF